jgi:hypothetical protein
MLAGEGLPMNFVMFTKSRPPLDVESAPMPSAVPQRRLDAIKGRPAAQAAPSNGRFATRTRSNSAGFLSVEGFSAALRCTVCDTSSSGALIEVPKTADGRPIDADDIPARFTLVFVGYREQTEVTCQVVRRIGQRVGVRYVGGFKTVATKPAARPAQKKR